MRNGKMLTVLGLLFTLHIANAGQVNWGSTRFATNLTSSGQQLSSDFTFEVGAFEADFEPTSENVAEWEARWVPVQGAEYNPKHRFFAGSVLVKGGTLPGNISEQGYIWGFDSKAAGGEWVLMTSPEWSWPNADELSNPVDWYVSSASVSIVGAVAQGSARHIVTERIAFTGGGGFAANWIASHFPGNESNAAISGWDSDPDGDGATNLVEMALGSDPLAVQDTNLPTVGQATVDGKRYLTLTINKAAADAVHYTVESSGDLKQWTADGPVVLEETADTLVVRDGRATSLTLGGREVKLRIERFLRLAVKLKT